MTLDQFVALSASLAACASAVATFLTIRQMAKQREDSYRPVLAFSTTNFKGSSATDGQLPNDWVARTLRSESSNTQCNLEIPLHNVGLGAARDISLTWSFPIERTVEKASALAQQTLVPYILTFEEGLLSITSDSSFKHMSMWRNQQHISIDFVLSASVSKEPYALRLPDAYIQLCSALIYFVARNNKVHESPVFPLLTAKLEYQDIGGTRHEAEFEFTIVLEAFSRQVIFGTVECKKLA